MKFLVKQCDWSIENVIRLNQFTSSLCHPTKKKKIHQVPYNTNTVGG